MHLEAYLPRIQAALEAAKQALTAFTPGAIEAMTKQGDDPVTEADRVLDTLLREMLWRRGEEGWLSEETRDSPERLGFERVWIVDPLDGTREFVQGIPEWCVSVGLVQGGRPVAGGIYIPPTDQFVLGAVGLGVTLNGVPVAARTRTTLAGAEVQGSRSESKRGEWKKFEGREFTVKPTGSVAYKLALVASGQTDCTFTLVPKNEWDVAAGCALVRAAGGEVCLPDGGEPLFNRPDTLYPGLLAGCRGLLPALRELVAPYI